MHRNFGCAALCAAAFAAVPAYAAPTLMSAEWAAEACKAWNQDPVLTMDLAESGWVKNDKGRGFKVMQIYRSDCEGSARVEMRIAPKAGKAECVFGGKAETTKLDPDADYVMFADTKRWQEMGAGEYGPMKAMFLSRLQFQGPMMEAMGNMTPFESFLLLTGKVPGDAVQCPAK